MATDSSSTSSKDVPKATAATFTSYVSVPLSIDKLDGSNYDSWASNITFWLIGQDYADHLTKNVKDVPNKGLGLMPNCAVSSIHYSSIYQTDFLGPSHL